MTSDLFTELLRCVSVLAMFLLIGTFLRAKVKVFQKIFLPASVIGGFLLLLLGPVVWGENSPLRILGVNMDWVKTWSLLPGILIVPIFAAVPLGMLSGREKQSESDKKDKKKNKRKLGFILASCGIFTSVQYLQTVIGFGTNIVYSKFNPNSLYRTFGYELPSGFVGGHGTAGAVGKILQDFGMDYWETAQGITTTTATVGLIGGMIIGIILINIAARKGETEILDNPEDIPVELKQGFTKNIKKQESLGRETTYSSSIETVTFHLAIILLGVACGFYMRNILLSVGLEIAATLPVWFYGLFSMFIIDSIIAKLNLSFLVDSKVKARITGSISDFAIISAIGSVPIQAVMTYIVPIVIMCILGFILTYFLVFKQYKKYFNSNAPFEHAIIAWGSATGVMINGMMLLKICDPNYETPALMNFSLGFSLMGMLTTVGAIIQMPILKSGSTMKNLILAFIMLIFYQILAYIGYKMIQNNTQEEQLV